MSPILFLMAIDWVMRETTADKPRGIQWTLFSELEDLDSRLRRLTDLNGMQSKQVLNINASKTKMICINANPDAPITVF